MAKVYSKIIVLFISQGKTVPNEIKDGVKGIVIQIEDSAAFMVSLP